MIESIEHQFRRTMRQLSGKPSTAALRQARRTLRELAETGHSRAQVALGTTLVSGEGGRRNLASAFNLYRAAARRGDIDAFHNLGQMYWWGEHVRQNRRRAVFWFARAASGQHPRALFRFAEALILGIGVRRDARRGARLMRLAARRGDPDAKRVVTQST